MPGTEVVLEAMSESQFQGLVSEYAQVRGWQWFHVPDEVYRHFPQLLRPGFLDFWAAREKPVGMHRLVIAELKTQRGRTTKTQRSWLEALGGAGSMCDGMLFGLDSDVTRKMTVETYIWRPMHWSQIHEVLR